MVMGSIPKCHPVGFQDLLKKPEKNHNKSSSKSVLEGPKIKSSQANAPPSSSSRPMPPVKGAFELYLGSRPSAAPDSPKLRCLGQRLGPFACLILFDRLRVLGFCQIVTVFAFNSLGTGKLVKFG